MRTLFTLIMLLTTFSLLKADNYHPKNYNGIWHNNYTGKNIEIKANAHGFRVRGLSRYNHWVWFERSSNNTYFDHYGNKIKTKGAYIRFYSARKHRRLTFMQIQGDNCQHPTEQNRQKSHKKYDNEYDDDDYYDAYDRNGGTNDKDRYLDGEDDNASFPITSQRQASIDVEGTWQVLNSDKKVYITDTRDGLKARFSNELKWYVYRLDPSTGKYIAENGSMYSYENDRLVWKDKSNQKKFILTKVSDAFDE